MPENVLSPFPSGTSHPAPAPAAASTVSANRLPLPVGTQIEARILELLPSLQARVQVRPPGMNGAWSAPLTVRLNLSPPQPSGLPAPTLQPPQAPGVPNHPPSSLTAVVAQERPVLARITSNTALPEIQLLPVRGEQFVQSATTMTLSSYQQWFSEQIRQTLPGAQHLHRGLEQISRLLENENLSNTPSGKALKSLLDGLLQVHDLTTPDALKSSFLRSGTWLESLLAKASANPSLLATKEWLEKDFKARISRLSEQLQQASSTSSSSGSTGYGASLASLLAVSQQVESMLKQTALMQLQTLENGANQNQPGWFLEIPVQTDQGIVGIRARIQQNRSHPPRDEDGWQIRLDLHLPRIGQVRVNLRFQGEHLNALFIAEQTRTVGILQEHKQELWQRLEQRNLKVNTLQARQGTLTEESAFRHDLIDEQA